MTTRLLLIAAGPALLASLLLMAIADAARPLLMQQGAVAVIGAVALLILLRLRKTKIFLRAPYKILFAMAACLFVPLAFGLPGNPHRWLVIGGVRLYVVAVVVPAFLFIWQHASASENASQPACVVAAMLVALSLYVQPDAAQLSAFVLAAVPILAVSNLARTYKVIAFATLVITAFAGWYLPDPLSPVCYVEGVFDVARDFARAALLTAIIAACLPVLALAWLAFVRRSVGLQSVAIYFATLYALAPLQVTPVPLLGFGASPILGYFLVSFLAEHVATPNVANSIAQASRLS